MESGGEYAAIFPRVRNYCSRKGRKAPTLVGAQTRNAKEDWLLEIGERIAHVPHAWDFKGGPRRTILDA